MAALVQERGYKAIKLQWASINGTTLAEDINQGASITGSTIHFSYSDESIISACLSYAYVFRCTVVSNLLRQRLKKAVSGSVVV
jgi:hypothetical protein